MKKWQEVRRGPVAAIFPEAPPVVFTAKNTHGQTVGGFCRDLSTRLGSLWVNRGHVAISAEASTWIAGPIHKGKGVCIYVCICASVWTCVCVCVCACAWAWGKGVSWEMNQPLSSATRPLTYRARFSGTQRSTLTLSRISLSLFCHFSLPPPPLSSEVNKELFQGDVRNRGGCCVRKRTCTCVRAMESVGHIRELRQPSRICTPS